MRLSPYSSVVRSNKIQSLWKHTFSEDTELFISLSFGHNHGFVLLKQLSSLFILYSEFFFLLQPCRKSTHCLHRKLDIVGLRMKLNKRCFRDLFQSRWEHFLCLGFLIWYWPFTSFFFIFCILWHFTPFTQHQTSFPYHLSLRSLPSCINTIPYILSINEKNFKPTWPLN